ncbi:hypothetical protein BSLG_002681 [Batrachochytrium salamandrivorans]|nr:hypothetical protein BSLG_002681 [Batrachochytrium salamandrivorans]
MVMMANQQEAGHAKVIANAEGVSPTKSLLTAGGEALHQQQQTYQQQLSSNDLHDTDVQAPLMESDVDWSLKMQGNEDSTEFSGMVMLDRQASFESSLSNPSLSSSVHVALC